jgi:hypothetical protein
MAVAVASAEDTAVAVASVAVMAEVTVADTTKPIRTDATSKVRI